MLYILESCPAVELILDLILGIPRVPFPKGEKTCPGPMCIPSCKFSRWSARNICPGKNTYFSLSGTPLGSYRTMLYILESCPAVQLILSSNWHVTLRLTVFEIFGFRAKILAFPWGYRP